ncbi:MarR family winged helix-turn-helix transcriptional regulator [Desmospora activa]|uniref:HTH-type transcriptional regulator SarZ n=1 Tax=Desmospora activa DSM 45169 TaxID=1121389 RepID=A0A2T4Z0S4_9BACL|nr:MarR family transcriptional regulator [Desmospora activa]PTM53341.1 MarR family transcriptional regulator [Desmospora activa DSM 45169]
MNLFDLTGYLVNRTDVKITNYFSKCLKPYQITPEQWAIICVLDEKKMTQKELSSSIDRNQTTVVRMVNLLEKKCIVSKEYNADDKRSHFIKLTKKGQQLQSELIPVVLDAHRRVTEGLSEEDLKQIQFYLNKLYQNVNKHLF